MKSIIFFCSIVSIYLSSCTKDFEEMNTNPNKPTTISNESAILKAQIQLATELMESRETGFGKWVQYYTPDINSTRSFHTDDVDIFWNYQALHTSALRSVAEVLRNTESNPDNNYRAMALALKSWTYLYMTDLLGPVPYFEATKGDLLDAGLEQFTPAFNTQQEIYMDINKVLKDANSLFDIDPASPFVVKSSVDIFAKGDMLAWKKFTNSLRARMLIRMSDADPQFAKTELAELFSNPSLYPVFESNDDDFGMIWTGAAGEPYANTLADSYRVNEYTWPASSGIINMLGRLNDPRMEIYFIPSKSSTKSGDPIYVGAPTAVNGAKYESLKRDTISQINPRFAVYNQKKYILTYAELLFIKAEAASKGMITGSASDFYTNAVESNLKKFGIAPAAITSYLAQNSVKYNTSKALEQIITQKYLSMIFQARDIYPEIRRTGFPILEYYKIGTVAVDVAKGYPEKHMYPGSSDTRRNDYLKVLGVSDNTMWGTKLWFASNRTQEIQMYTNAPPTSLTGWRKNISGGYVSLEIPYVEK